MLRVVVGIAILVHIVGCVAPPGSVNGNPENQVAEGRVRAPKDPFDAETFEQLRKAGHDFAKPTTVDFYLYFPDEAAARATIHVLSSKGYSGDLKNVDGRWQAHLAKDMVLTADAIDFERFQMRDLTVNAGGEYDGWGAQVVSKSR